MADNSIAAQVKAIIVEKLSVEESEVVESATFTGDLGADSLDTVEMIMEFEKKFLIIGNPNALHYKEIFPLIKDNKVWVGYKSMGADMLFDVTLSMGNWLKENKKQGSAYRIVDGVLKGRTQAIWFTNLDIKKRHEDLILYKRYSPDEYIRYENYDAIEVSKVEDIPDGYYDIMGVPDTFLEFYNPEQFEIIGCNCSTEQCRELGVKPLGKEWIERYRAAGGTGHNTANMVRMVYSDLNGKPKVAFSRIIVRRKKQ